MAPGAKKKNNSRRAIDNQPEGKKNVRNNFVDKPDIAPVKEPETDLNQTENQDKRYNKRSISSNWHKYDELPVDPHADVTRGKDFEVLLSYSGGSSSQLQLQDEKDWDEAVDDHNIALDIKDLVSVVKTIPFHEQLNLPSYIFTESQLAKFNSTAETWKKSYTLNQSSKVVSNGGERNKETFEIPNCLDSGLNIIDNSLPEDDVSVSKRPILLEEKTESIIESLAACLSLKTPVLEKNDLKEEVKKETFTDDLDFLLSLNVSLKNPIQEEKKKESDKTNIDDWLNNLLDD